MQLDTLPPELRNKIVGKVFGVPVVDERGETRHLMHPLRRLVTESMSTLEKDNKKEQEPITEVEKDYISMSSTCKPLRDSCRFFAHQILANEIKATFDANNKSWTVNEVKSSFKPSDQASALVVSVRADTTKIEVAGEAEARAEWNKNQGGTPGQPVPILQSKDMYGTIIPSDAERQLPPPLKALAAGWQSLHALSVSTPQALVWLPAIIESLPHGRAQLTELDATGILDLTKYECDYELGMGIIRRGYDSLFDEALEYLSKCKKLKWLKLDGHPNVPIFDLKGPVPRAFGGLQDLRGLTKLEELTVRHYPLARCYPDILFGRQPQPDRFPVWQTLPSCLRALTLEHVYICDDTVVTALVLSTKSTLERLQLKNCILAAWNQQVAGGRERRRMKALKHLDIQWRADLEYPCFNQELKPPQLLYFTSPVLRTCTVDHLFCQGAKALTTFFTTEDGSELLPTLEKVHIKGNCKSSETAAVDHLKAKLVARGVDAIFTFDVGLERFGVGGGSFASM